VNYRSGEFVDTMICRDWAQFPNSEWVFFWCEMEHIALIEEKMIIRIYYNFTMKREPLLKLRPLSYFFLE